MEQPPAKPYQAKGATIIQVLFINIIAIMTNLNGIVACQEGAPSEAVLVVSIHQSSVLDFERPSTAYSGDNGDDRVVRST